MDVRVWLWGLMVAAAMVVSGCSMRGLAVDTVGDMLAGSGSAFTEDDDVELVGEALPFSLKLTDSLLQESPDHRGLLHTGARGYVLYSYAYVQFPAEKAAADDLGRARELRDRARKLYFRAFDYAMRGLESDYPGLAKAMMVKPSAAVQRVDGGKRREVAFLYWAASALGLAISVSKDDPAMLARLPEVEALLQRALALDESFGHGALHEFALTLAAATPRRPDRDAVERHYRRALELSHGRRASLYVAYALAVPLRAQDRKAFVALIDKALAVDPDAVPRLRLQNTIAQRRARWLLGRTDELFLN